MSDTRPLSWSETCLFNHYTGKPSSLYLELDPDWAPSLKLGYGPSNLTVSDRYDRFQARAKRRRVAEVIEVEDNVQHVIENPDPSNSSDLNLTSELLYVPLVFYTNGPPK